MKWYQNQIYTAKVKLLLIIDGKGFRNNIIVIKKIAILIAFFVFDIRIWHSQDRALWYILVIKANKMHYFSTLFW